MTAPTSDLTDWVWPAANRIPPELHPDEVHVWRACIRQSVTQLGAWRATMTEDERAKAGRFRQVDDRLRAEVSRGLLREVLGACLAQDGTQLRFGVGDHGKPRLVGADEGAGWEFNISHSGEWVLIAVTHGRAVGVDVEQIRPVEEAELAEAFFSPAERAEWLAVPKGQRTKVFFDGWTRKEAYLKAWGTGLGKAPTGFQVRLDPTRRAAVISDEDDEAAAERWSMWAVPMDADHVAALVVAGPSRPVRCWEWRVA